MNGQTPGIAALDRVLLRMAGRVRWLGGLLTLGIAVVLSAYWYHQIVRADHYEHLAETNRLRVLRLEAPRGSIVDRSGQLLAENVPLYRLLIDRSSSEDLNTSLAFAAGILERRQSELRSALERSSGVSRDVPVLLAEDLDLGQVAQFEVAAPEQPEFRISTGRRRFYRHGSRTAHLLGYLGEPTVDERESDATLAPDELVGRTGVELAAERRLRGTAGERTVVVDSRGRVMSEQDVHRVDAAAGESLTLTIDVELQQLAASLLIDKVGAIVALDPRDGAVRAMASSPTFDPNSFGKRLSPEEWQRIIGAPHEPLQNRAIQNTYPPGSVFKIAVALAVLSNGLIDPGATVDCGGTTMLYNRRWRCWLPGGHGAVDLRRALQHSCDIYFYRQGLQLGIDAIASAARRLGLGRRTGIDLPGEREGLVPDPEWSERQRGFPWYRGETVSVAIGQGPLLTSPLQVAVMTAAVANGGYRVRPYLLEGEADPPEALGLDPLAVAYVAEALANVVARGTGSSARTRVVSVAGKTGTAQVVAQATWTPSETLPPDQADHAWFTSFAPVEAPELVVVVFVEHGGRGSEAAAPLARLLHESYFGASART